MIFYLRALFAIPSLIFFEFLSNIGRNEQANEDVLSRLNVSFYVGKNLVLFRENCFWRLHLANFFTKKN